MQSLLTLALAVSGSFERLAILANVSALALYLGCAIAAWRLRVAGSSRGDVGPRVPLAGVAPLLAVPVIVWLLTGLTRDEWIGYGACGARLARLCGCRAQPALSSLTRPASCPARVS